MNADLVGASSFRGSADQREFISVHGLASETLLNAKLGYCICALGMNYLLQPNRGRLMFSLSIHRRFYPFRFPIRPAPNNREIFFVQMSILHEQTESSRGRGSFCDQDNAARFAVEAIHD